MCRMCKYVLCVTIPQMNNDMHKPSEYFHMSIDCLMSHEPWVKSIMYELKFPFSCRIWHKFAFGFSFLFRVLTYIPDWAVEREKEN